MSFSLFSKLDYSSFPVFQYLGSQAAINATVSAVNAAAAAVVIHATKAQPTAIPAAAEAPLGRPAAQRRPSAAFQREAAMAATSASAPSRAGLPSAATTIAVAILPV